MAGDYLLSMRKTLKNILAEYGMIAVVVYLSLFTIVFVGSYFAIRLGWTPGSTVGQAGAWTAAYLVTKIAQPLRIAATVLITTFVGRIWENRKGASAADEPGAPAQ
jgi:4-amino-4-deoxy-L-arabinose transferase-like glycosyltransferase